MGAESGPPVVLVVGVEPVDSAFFAFYFLSLLLFSGARGRRLLLHRHCCTVPVGPLALALLWHWVVFILR
jgi:hypothetical protein